MHLLTSRTLASAVLLMALALPAPSDAQTRRRGCSLTVYELVFGEYDVFSASPTEAVTRILVDCGREDSRIRPRVELSTGSSQSFISRTQRSGPHVLTYNIYADRALTQIVGDGSSGTTAVFLDAIGGGLGTKKVDLYGAIDPRQFAPPGSYFDTVYVTLIF
jgi:spore coat protein U-like protein